MGELSQPQPSVPVSTPISDADDELPATRELPQNLHSQSLLKRVRKLKLMLMVSSPFPPIKNPIVTVEFNNWLLLSPPVLSFFFKEIVKLKKEHTLHFLFLTF